MSLLLLLLLWQTLVEVKELHPENTVFLFSCIDHDAYTLRKEFLNDLVVVFVVVVVVVVVVASEAGGGEGAAPGEHRLPLLVHRPRRVNAPQGVSE
jgi:glycerol uptake facilitator-like aquaporin